MPAWDVVLGFRVALAAMKRLNAAKLIRTLVCLLLIATLVAACSGPDGNGTAEREQVGTDPTGTLTAAGGGAAIATRPVDPVTDDPTQPAVSATDTTIPAAPTDTAALPTPGSAPLPSPTAVVQDSNGILPGHRIISFYGHPNSEQMGILGEYPIDELYGKLQEQAAAYDAADPAHPTVMAFELIATVAQQSPGDDGTYVAYSGDEIIQEYVDFATAHNMIVILDLQIGWDTIPNQINLIRHWLELPNVHVALDPEFSTKANEIVPNDRAPGEFIGEADGRDIQKAVEMLAEISTSKGIPPKILVLHQFESDMIYNKDQISTLPGVDIVLDMDGFGGKDAKTGNYGHFVQQELIEYGGIKLFYKQDTPLLTPEEVVALDPPALLVIYQ
jgi:hypothetical protein